MAIKGFGCQVQSVLGEWDDYLVSQAIRRAVELVSEKVPEVRMWQGG